MESESLSGADPPEGSVATPFVPKTKQRRREKQQTRSKQSVVRSDAVCGLISKINALFSFNCNFA